MSDPSISFRTDSLLTINDDMKVTVLVPYSSSPQSSSRPQSPLSFHRRGSLGGLLSPLLPSSLSSSPSAVVPRRRTIFTDSPFGLVSSPSAVAAPDALVEVLEGFAHVLIQTSLHPLPVSRPVVILVPLVSPSDHPLMKTRRSGSTTTPSAVCFPAVEPAAAPNPLIAAFDRALAFLRRAKRDLDDLPAEEDASQVILMAYSTSQDLPQDIASAALAQGAKGILTPPFTPESIAETFSEALDVPTDTLLSSSSSPVLLPRYPPYALHSPSFGGLSPLSISSFSMRIPPLFSRPSFLRSHPTYPFEKPLPSKPLPPLPQDTDSRSGSIDYSRPPSSAKQVPPPLFLNPKHFRSPSPPLPPLPSEEEHHDVLHPLLTPEDDTSPRRLPIPPPILTSRHETMYPAFPSPSPSPLYTLRRKSVDTGGLALALAACNVEGSGGDWFPWKLRGSGWGGWEDTPDIDGPLYAELLSDMYLHTHMTTDAPALNPPCSTFLGPLMRRRLIPMLSGWNFEPHLLTPDEVLACTYLLFEALFLIQGMEEECGTTPEQMLPFLQALRSIYQSQNKYHNFQHAIDVHQAIYSFLVESGCAPPVTILLEVRPKKLWSRPSVEGKPGVARGIQQLMGNRDLFALCLAAIGHDVGHPGLSNAFMRNARTPLSVVYDDKSALEQMHCALLLQLMRKHNLGHLISTSPTATSPIPSQEAAEFRHLLVQTVLITDMSLHFEWIGRFGKFATEGEASGKNGEKVLLCQALIKCGDISNPTRPHAVSEHWSSALLEEWACQASLERELGLPVSVVSTTDAIVQAKGQIGFIDLFTKPLFDATATAVPELDVFARQCGINRSLWQERLDRLNAAQEAGSPPTSISSLSEPPSSPLSPINPLHSQDLNIHDKYRSVFPLSLPKSLVPPTSPLVPFTNPWSPQGMLSGRSSPDRHTDKDMDRGSDSSTPTFEARNKRERGPTSSISSSNASITSPSPFSPGGVADNASTSASTAASSPLSYPRSLGGSLDATPGLLLSNGLGGGETPGSSSPMRMAYNNASVKKKKSFHRISWDVQGNQGQRMVPPIPSLPTVPQ